MPGFARAGLISTHLLVPFFGFVCKSIIGHPVGRCIRALYIYTRRTTLRGLLVLPERIGKRDVVGFCKEDVDNIEQNKTLYVLGGSQGAGRRYFNNVAAVAVLCY